MIVTLVIVCAFLHLTKAQIDPFMCVGLEDEARVPSPIQCNQFFVCEGGMPSDIGICPPNMLFSPDSLQCDFLENVDCGDVPLPPDFTTIEPEITTTTTTSAPEVSSCPKEDPEEPIFLPVRDDCGAYILCFHGREIIRRCPNNLFWNSKTLDCDDPSKVTCLRTDPFGCPDEGILFLPHPDSCSKYIYCRDGFSRVQSCAFFKVFDENLRSCVAGSSCLLK
ncbi:peritrophin-1-like [Uranotaenia lowii]|uniref:peritrophin-1-like n=1 Tax=Uranotaenia lowii TaxID=190385 RepID=UPI002478745E|nr:peritrophin-1-like [Uranotaenia lowii]